MAKNFQGVVVSDKGQKTIVVLVETRKTHPLYKKQYTVSKKFMAHDEKNEAKPGDKVIIAETKPISKRKKFILTNIISKSKLSKDDLVVTKDVEADKLPESKSKAPKETK
jgi:small subunit ribosomal protein S17